MDSVPAVLWLSLASGLGVVALLQMRAARFTVAGTTVGPAIRWAFAAGLVWMVWCLGLWSRLFGEETGTGWLDRLAYLAAVLSLCPPMMVLGARRPTNRSWTPFVIAPMIAVLCWPLVTMRSWDRRLELETPQLMGFVLVAVMSYGNYIGGRLTFPALLIGASLIFSTVDVSRLGFDRPDRIENLIALVVLAAGVLIGVRRLRSQNWPSDRFDRVWQEFSMLFGLVWSRRLLDRINAIAVKQQWPGRLQADGFHWDSPPDEATQQQVEHALRWLLRRFVDVEWLDGRLGAKMATETAPMAIDT